MQVGTGLKQSGAFGLADKNLHQRHYIAKGQTVTKGGERSGTDAGDAAERLVDGVPWDLRTCFVTRWQVFPRTQQMDAQCTGRRNGFSARLSLLIRLVWGIPRVHRRIIKKPIEIGQILVT